MMNNFRGVVELYIIVVTCPLFTLRRIADCLDDIRHIQRCLYERHNLLSDSTILPIIMLVEWYDNMILLYKYCLCGIIVQYKMAYLNTGVSADHSSSRRQ